MISAATQQYVKDNWAKLSPTFRAAHNRLRQRLGMETLPPPKIDLYVPARGPAAKPFDPTNPDFVASAREFLGPVLGPRGGEGFTINGETSGSPHRAKPKPASDGDEGFVIR
jgi:hypothetical protein